jgi:hypothetical protein
MMAVMRLRMACDCAYSPMYYLRWLHMIARCVGYWMCDWVVPAIAVSSIVCTASQIAHAKTRCFVPIRTRLLFYAPLLAGAQPRGNSSNGCIHSRGGAAQERRDSCNRGLAGAVPIWHPSADRWPQLWRIRCGVCRILGCWIPSAAVWHQQCDSSTCSRALAAVPPGKYSVCFRQTGTPACIWHVRC